MSLLVQCTKREAFHTLRTVEQLGYMVCSEHDIDSEVNDWAVLLRSSTSMGSVHCPCRSLLLSPWRCFVSTVNCLLEFSCCIALKILQSGALPPVRHCRCHESQEGLSAA